MGRDPAGSDDADAGSEDADETPPDPDVEAPDPDEGADGPAAADPEHGGADSDGEPDADAATNPDEPPADPAGSPDTPSGSDESDDPRSTETPPESREPDDGGEDRSADAVDSDVAADPEVAGPSGAAEHADAVADSDATAATEGSSDPDDDADEPDGQREAGDEEADGDSGPAIDFDEDLFTPNVDPSIAESVADTDADAHTGGDGADVHADGDTDTDTDADAEPSGETAGERAPEDDEADPETAHEETGAIETETDADGETEGPADEEETVPGGEAMQAYDPDNVQYDLDADYGPSGPSEDREMPLTEHIEEMLKRLAVVMAVAGLVSVLTFPFAERLINFLWNSILPAGDLTRPRLYGILELKLTELKVASLAGLVVALPVVVYETYQFMRPGLFPHERRYYLAAIPTSLVLALVGVSFAYFIVLPAIFTYFLYYSQDVATIGFALGRTFDLVLLLMGYMALVFQIPLFLMLAMMMGLVTRQWLADRRLIFWGSFLGLSFIFSPDPTGMAPIVVALTMIVLFEGTLLLTKWTNRGRRATA